VQEGAARLAPLLRATAIIPVYNGERFVAEAVETVLAQTASTACVVVDDGSTDSTAEIVGRFGDAVTLLRQDNRGVSAARNAGARAAETPFIGFLDADDRWAPDKIARQLDALDRTGATMALCGLVMIDEDGRPTGRAMAAPDDPRLLRRMVMFDGIEVPSCSSTMLIARDAFDALGGFDERLGMSADWMFLARYLVRFGAPTPVRPELTQYRLHDQNMSRSIPALERDMRQAFATLFSEPDLPAEVRSAARAAHYRLYRMLAGSYAHQRRVGGTLRNLARMAAVAIVGPPHGVQ
jgi:glycosyltransferase involved in cell wall biosynthesis